MSLLRLKPGFLAAFALLGLCCSSFASGAQHPAKRSRTVSKMTEPAVAETPTPPPPPLTPEQMPAQVPNVSFQDGMLTIDAENSNLSDILAAVHKVTGADIDITGNPGSERVASRVGPGPARDVMSQLLQGSKFDYVMLSSAVNPSGIERIILTPRSAKASSGPAGGPPTPAQNRPPTVVADDDDADQSDEPPPPANANQQQVVQPPQPGAPNQPGVQPGYQIQPGTGLQPVQPNPAPDGSDQQQPPRTPEQMLQELQRIQQMQQQQQQLQQQLQQQQQQQR